MAMDLTCLNINLTTPIIPITANESNNFTHSAYEPDSGGIAQMISGLITGSAFSTNDFQSLLKTVFDKAIDSWTVSEITKTKPITSIIIYISIILGLFFSLSMTFCGTSCRKYQGRKRRQSKALNVGVCLLIIVYLLGIGDMIYVAYRVNKSKVSIDDAIKQVNREVYPKEISEHIIYLNNEIKILDQYCTQKDSILINASKSMLVKAFERILNEKYLVQNISQTVNSIDAHIQELDIAINESASLLPPEAIGLFKHIQEQYKSMLNLTQLPLQEVCNYANGTHSDIDDKLLAALFVVHVELERAINTINNDILIKITPGKNHLLMNIELEEQIRYYVSLSGTIFFVLVIVFGAIPLIFFVFILLSYLCGCDRDDENNKNQFRLNSVRGISDITSKDGYSDDEEYSRHGSHNHRSRVRPSNYRGHIVKPRKTSSNDGASRVLLCLMRIGFGVMMIMLIVMILLTGVYYALDLALHGSCRAVHNDQPFLINFATEQLIKSNIVFFNDTAMNTIITNVINDCRDNVHFSKKLLENYWSILDHDVDDMMNTLSKQIYDQFINAIGKINIPGDIELLRDFVSQANVSNIPLIADGIRDDLNTMEKTFEKINSSSSTLPQNLVQSTIDKFKNYVQEVLESTVDSCPLPLATIYKTDTLVCHTMGSSLGGLWLSVLIFMFVVTIGFCIFGVCIYKRISWSPTSKSMPTERF